MRNLSSKNPEIIFDVRGARVCGFINGVSIEYDYYYIQVTLNYVRWSYQGNEIGNKLFVLQ